MSDKLTKEMIDALIQEAMLQERYEFDGSKPAVDFLRDLDVGNKKKFEPEDQKVKPLQRISRPNDKYTTADIAKAIADDSVPPEVRTAASLIAKKAKNPDFVKELPKELEDAGIDPKQVDLATDFEAGKATKSIDIDSFSFPRPLTNLAATSEGKFFGSQNELINSIFDETTMLGRLQKLDQVSTALLDETEIKQLEPRKLLQYTMLADLFELYIDQIDQRAGGYMFEAFLANLVGGSVEGGSNGIADFNSPSGDAGSAKLYKAWSGIEQSLKDLENVGTSVHYVIGIHDATKQADKRTKIDLYYVITTLTANNKTEGTKQIAFSDVDGVVRNAATFSGNKFLISDFTKPEQYKVGTFSLADTSGKDYKKILKSAMKATDAKKDSKTAFDAMRQFYNYLYQAEEQTKKYTSQKNAGDLTAANKALRNYDLADEKLNKLLVSITPGKKVKGDRKKRELKENKMTELDLMIENMVKEFIKGNLND